MCEGMAMFSRLISLCVLLMPSAALAFGNDTEWTSGWGMGTKEAIITKGPGNEIYVACEDGSLSPSSISFMLDGQSAGGGIVTLTFDGAPPEDFWTDESGVITSDCHACASNFDRAILMLKTHNSVYVRFQNGLMTQFTLKGSKEAIGECIAGFYKN